MNALINSMSELHDRVAKASQKELDNQIMSFWSIGYRDFEHDKYVFVTTNNIRATLRHLKQRDTWIFGATKRAWGLSKYPSFVHKINLELEL